MIKSVTKYLTFFKIVLTATALLLICGCSGQDKIDPEAFPQLDVISFGTVTTDGSTTITIPLQDLANDETELENVSIQIYTNDQLTHSDISATQFYNDSFDVVMFSIQGVKAGDNLALHITKSDGTNNEYLAILSSSNTVYP